MKTGAFAATPAGSNALAMPVMVGIVEDDFEVRTRFECAIRMDPRLSLAFSVGSYQEAREAGQARAVDVLLVDLGLPDRDGRDVIRWYARHKTETLAMVITVFGDEEHVITSFEAGAVGYLLKDTPVEELSQHVIDLHAGGSPISPAVARSVILRFSQVRRVSQSESTLLSPRELEVLRLVEKGLTYDEIAQNLNVTWHTVTGYLRRVYRKLEVNSRTQAVFEARMMGIL